MTSLHLERLEDRLVPATLLPGFVESLVATNINLATSMETAPDGDLWVLEQSGRVLRFRQDQLSPDVVGDLSGLGLDPTGERGLLGIAFDPNYAANRHVYFYYTATVPATHNQVDRFTVDTTNASDYSLTGRTSIFTLDNLGPATNHNGGSIHFGSDGNLYIATGENNVPANAQSLNTTHGKLLRINADGSIPGDNPFVATTTGNNQAIWAVGLRNPFVFAVQPGSGRIFINDVGQGSFEEINDGVAGANYGWPGTEGNTGTPPASPGTYRGPLYTYGHGAGAFTGFVITGGAFYNPGDATFPSEYAGDYFFSDGGSGWINAIDTSTQEVRTFASGIFGPVALKVAGDGSLYYLARENGVGRVFRIQATTGQTFETVQPSGTDSLRGSGIGDFTGGSDVAVASLGATQTGQWQYSLDNGATWLGFGVPSSASARLLRATDRVRFLPSSDYAGGATLTYRSWDGTGGTAGGVADLTGGTGTGTAYGATLNTAAVVETTFRLRGNRLDVTGTAGNEAYEVVAGLSSRLSINGTLYSFPVGVRTLAITGLAGTDSLSVLGSTAAEVATLLSDAGRFAGPGYNVDWAGIEIVYTYGQGGIDSASLYDSAGNDTFGANPNYAYLQTPSTIKWAVGFDVVYGYSVVGGSDAAFLFDSAGSETLGTNPDYGYLLGANFALWGVGFEALYGYSSGGGDAAYLFDSAGNDVFGARPEYAYLQGSSNICWAVGFANVNAYSLAGGTDGAYLYDSAGDDQFTGAGIDAVMALGLGGRYAVQGFELVSITSLRGGVDRRTLGGVGFQFEQTGPWV